MQMQYQHGMVLLPKILIAFSGMGYLTCQQRTQVNISFFLLLIK